MIRLPSWPILRKRREVAAIGALIVLVAAATGCSIGNQAGSQTPTPTTRQGGTITVGVDLETTGLDVHVVPQAQSWVYFGIVYEGLVALKDGVTPIPNLAQSWNQPSPTSWVFRLRTDVKFSNGRPMDASDVVATFQRILDPKTGAFFRSFVGPLQTVTAVDNNTVRFDFSSPYPAFVDILAVVSTSILPAKERQDGSFDPTKAMLGTGPFMVKEHLEGQSWTFVRNPHYWRTGYPKADQLVVPIFTDTSARLAALRNGTIDVALFKNTDAISQLQSVPNAKGVAQNWNDYYNVYFNTVAPTSRVRDPKVRQAINMAINRKQIIDLALGGVAKDIAPGPGSADSCSLSSLQFFAHDPNKARQLLSEAGASNLTVDIIAIADTSPQVAVAQVIQQNLRAVGITANLDSMPVGEWATRLLDGRFDLGVSFETTYTNPIIGFGFLDVFPRRAKFQTPDAQLQGLLSQARQVGPGADRKALFQQICNVVDRNPQNVPLPSRAVVIGYRSDKVLPVIPPDEAAEMPFRYVSEYGRIGP